MTEPDPAGSEVASPPVESAPAAITAAPVSVESAPPAVERAPVERCLNCGAPLVGAYCSECGQRTQLRRLSMAALFHDVLHDLVDLDSRVWRTLVALLFRPGRLTNEFIAGRRTFYFPPFRLYLVLSLVYFLLPSFSDKAAFDLGTDNKGVVTDLNSKEGQQTIKEAMHELKRDLGGASGGADDAPKAPPPPVAGVRRKQRTHRPEPLTECLRPRLPPQHSGTP